MAYGVQIKTSQGMMALAGLSSIRVVGIVEVRSISGSASVPAFSEANGDWIPVMNVYAALLPLIEWDEATKTVSWSNPTSINAAAICQDFDIYFAVNQ